MKWVVLVLFRVALIAVSLSCAAVSAQPAAAFESAKSAAALPGGAVVARQPVIDPAIELRGAALTKELRQGGYVLYMRHAINGPGNTTSDNPCPGGDSPLTEEGRFQALAVGQALRNLKIRIGKVSTSVTCRARMTGELVAGTGVELSVDLNPVNPAESKDWVALRQALLNTPPVAGTNTLLVSHFHGAPNPQDRLFLDMAEVIVFSPRAPGRPLAMARLPITLWAELLQANDSGR